MPNGDLVALGVGVRVVPVAVIPGVVVPGVAVPGVLVPGVWLPARVAVAVALVARGLPVGVLATPVGLATVAEPVGPGVPDVGVAAGVIVVVIIGVTLGVCVSALPGSGVTAAHTLITLKTIMARTVPIAAVRSFITHLLMSLGFLSVHPDFGAK